MVEGVLAQLAEEFTAEAGIVACHLVVEVELEVHGVAVPQIVVVPACACGVEVGHVTEFAMLEAG